MELLNSVLNAVNGVLWHEYVLYFVLAVGVLFTIWSGFCQYRALTHGVSVVRGKYDDKADPGAINHFQALSAALSATVGLGNIAGVGVAVALGGPGAIFWMWMVGLFGMALKTTEVTLSMLYRNTDDPENPHGGPMYVAKRAFADIGLPRVGKIVGGIFVVTLLISTITGGNMFQSWSVGEITQNYFQVDSIVCGIILAVVVGLVIIGGIKRIGAVAGRIVPFMCIMYLLAAFVVLAMNFTSIPSMLILIVQSAFSTVEAEGAFLGGTAGYALAWGMKRALFSSEAGQGSSPIAHSAAKTDEPVREGVVAGLEPFIDTIVVCTLTALVILSTGAFNRGAEAKFAEGVGISVVGVMDGDKQMTNRSGTPLWTILVDSRIPIDEDASPGQDNVGGVPQWHVTIPPMPGRNDAARRVSGAWSGNERLFMLVKGDEDKNTGRDIRRMGGSINVTTNFGQALLNYTKALGTGLSLTDSEGKPIPDEDYEPAAIVDALRRAGIARITIGGETINVTEEEVSDARDPDREVIEARSFVWAMDFASSDRPELFDKAEQNIEKGMVFVDYPGPSLTGHAFDRAIPGLGKWLVTIAAWLFAISTMISWSYYGEKGIVYLFGEKLVIPYKLLYCIMIVVASAGFITTDAELDGFTALGTGVMLWANIPIMLIFGAIAMTAYHGYFRRMRSGDMEGPHDAPPITDVAEGKDVEEDYKDPKDRN